MKLNYAILAFTTENEWRQWLTINHSQVDGIWLKLYKKDSKTPSVSRAQALDQALCFGWIDGQSQSLDEQAYLQKYTPRRTRSIWSKRNIEHIERLEKAGLMTMAGTAEVDRAKADGRWEAAYDAPTTMTAPDYLLQALANNPAAYEFYKTLNKTNLYAIHWRLQTAKTKVTQARRLQKILNMLEAGEKFH